MSPSARKPRDNLRRSLPKIGLLIPVIIPRFFEAHAIYDS
jgi:hypothetical protein